MLRCGILRVWIESIILQQLRTFIYAQDAIQDAILIKEKKHHWKALCVRENRPSLCKTRHNQLQNRAQREAITYKAAIDPTRNT